MENQEWSFIDKSAWGEGLWQTEPDKAQWVDEKTGMPCLAVRQPTSGHWCGYVGVAPAHPWHEKGYNDCTQNPPCEESYCEHKPELQTGVHGGITFASSCNEENREHGVCHVPSLGEPENVWWFGFDCAHAGDQCPGNDAHYNIARGFLGDLGTRNTWDDYRTLDYVKSECADLAQQLHQRQLAATF